jgi:hypothetical protein
MFPGPTLRSAAGMTANLDSRPSAARKQRSLRRGASHASGASCRAAVSCVPAACRPGVGQCRDRARVGDARGAGSVGSVAEPRLRCLRPRRSADLFHIDGPVDEIVLFLVAAKDSLWNPPAGRGSSEIGVSTPRLTPAGEALAKDARRLIEGAVAMRARAASIAADIEPELVFAVRRLFFPSSR